MANGDNAPQFDGQNPVSGYTLVHRKDGTSTYLKGENLSSDDVVQRLSSLPTSSPPASQPARPSMIPSSTPQADSISAQPSFASDVVSRMQGPKSFWDVINPMTLAQPLTAAAGAISDRLRQSPAQVPGTRTSVGQATQNAGDMGNMIATTAGALSLPAAGEDLINVARGLQGVDIGEAMTGGKNAIARMMRKPATAAQSQAGVPGSIKQLPFLPKGMQPKIPEGLIPKGELGTPTNPGPFNRVPSRVSPSMRSDPFNPPAPFVNPGAPLPSADEFYQTRGSEMSNILKRGVNEPSEPFVNPGAPLPSSNEFYTNRGNEINSILRRGVNEPLTAYNTPPEAQSAEGVKGSVPKPSGRLVVLPQEAQALDQMQAIAEKRASQHGMQYAAGMRPAGGGRVPMTPTGITTTEFPVRPERAPMPWETQGSTASAFGPPLQTTTDTLGVRWATDGTNRVSIPKNIPPEAVESYARPKLAEQAQIRSQLPWMKGQQ